jgi:low affinity Fe/Cu permease
VNAFDRFADKVAHVWAQPWWFAICATFVLSWVAGLFGTQKWSDSVYHLWLNSPTTALTFVGVFLLHNEQSRFEKAVNHRLECIEEALGIQDPVLDEGQKVKDKEEEGK